MAEIIPIEPNKVMLDREIRNRYFFAPRKERFFMLYGLNASAPDVNLATVLSVVAIVVSAVIILLLGLFSKKYNTRTIVFAGISVALATVLSLVKFSPVTNGGAVTLASMVPLVVFAYIYGAVPSLLTGVCFGLISFVTSPWILTPVTFLLDYVIAYSTVAIVGFFGKNKSLKGLILGTSISYAVRLAVHFASGIIYFNLGAIWAELPQNSAVIYSLLYQLTYLVPDFLITLIALILLKKTGVIDRLEKMAKR